MDKPILVNVATHTYNDSMDKFVNALEVAAVVPHPYDSGESIIILRAGEKIYSKHPVHKIMDLLKIALGSVE